MATIDAFQEVLAQPHDRRADVYRDAEWRERMKSEHSIWGDRLTKATIQESERHRDLVPKVGQVIRDMQSRGELERLRHQVMERTLAEARR